MSRTTILIITLLVASLVGFALFDFYQGHEYRERTIHTGFRGEARENPLYASRLFLKRMGIPALTKDNLQVLKTYPDTHTVLLIDTNRSTLSTRRTKQVLEWVKSGGHLIARSTSDWYYNGAEKEPENEMSIDDSRTARQSPDPLQRRLGIHSGKRDYSQSFDDTEMDEDHKVTDFNDQENRENEDTGDRKPVYRISLNGVDKKLAIQSRGYRPLLVDQQHATQSEQIKLKSGNFIVRQKVGKGMVTLLADMDFIENRHIEELDHAEILWHLVHGLHASLDQPERVWLVHNDNRAPLWQLLWKHGWTLILSLLLLFLSWLLLVTRRFGPLIPKQTKNRRSLNEHISSSGNFYWKNKKKQVLVESARKVLMERLARVHPDWTQRSKQQQISLLTEQTGLTPDALYKILYAKRVQQADEFTFIIRQLEQIRKSI